MTKTASAAYIAKEEASTRKPVELYKIWWDTTYWYYTSGDVSVDFGGETYTPITVNRGSTEYNSTLDVNTLNIQFIASGEPVVQYIAQNPIGIIWVQVSRLFRDQSPLEAGVVFIGQVKSVSFKGLQANVNCVGFEHFLKTGVPVERYSITCNHKLFDTRCGLTKSSYKVTATITLDATGTILSSATFGAEGDAYMVGGSVEFGDEKRTIIAKSGNDITIQYKMIELESTDSVDAYPGCNGRAKTCYETFDNVVHGLWFPFIPQENPALRMS